MFLFLYKREKYQMEIDELVKYQMEIGVEDSICPKAITAIPCFSFHFLLKATCLWYQNL